MPDVEAQPQLSAGRPQSPAKLVVTRRALDEHPGLGLESDANALATAPFENGAETLAQSLPEGLENFRIAGFLGISHAPIRRLPGPERYDPRPQFRGQVDTASEEIDPPLPVLAILLQEGRVVLAARIEEKTRAGFDAQFEPQVVGSQPDFRNLVRLETIWIQKPRIGGQRHSFEAQFTTKLQRIADPMVRQAVRIVPEPEHPSTVVHFVRSSE